MGLTGAHFLGYNDGLDYFLAVLGLAACAGLLILTTPFLANYFVMNLALFLVLFVFGFLTARRAGVNYWMQIVMLAIFVFVGLDPQQPVATQTIIEIGAIVGCSGGTHENLSRLAQSPAEPSVAANAARRRLGLPFRAPWK